MANFTQASSNMYYYYVMYGLYFVEGSFIGGLNLLVALSIWKYNALSHKNHYLLIAAQSFADFLNMMGYTTAGVYRLILMSTSGLSGKISLWLCAMMPHRLLWGLTGDRLSSLMQLVIAVDRLLSVSYPLEYLSWSRRYSVGLICGAFGFIILAGFAPLPLAFQMSKKFVMKTCTAEVPRSFGTFYGWYYGTTAQIYMVASVMVFGLILIRKRNHAVKVTPSRQGRNNKQRQLAAQSHLTKSLTINCGAGILFFVFPFTVAQMSDRFGYIKLAKFSFVISNLYHLCDVIIYSWRHKEIRQAIKSFLICKPMPPDLRLWDQSRARNNSIAGISVAELK